MPDNTYKFFHVFKERCQQAGFIPNIVFSSPNFATVFALLKQYHNWIGYSFDFYIDQVMDEEIVTLPVEDGGWSWDVYIAYKPIVRSNYVAQFVKMKVENWGIALRYAILFLPTYLAIGCMINYTLRTDWPEWKDDLITVIMGSVGVWVCCLLNAIIINTAWSGQLFCDFKCLYSVLLFVPISIYISRKLYRMTNTVWSGAFCNAILLSWCIVAATGLSNYPQTWFSNFFGV